jgi:hypothetical protein
MTLNSQYLEKENVENMSVIQCYTIQNASHIVKMSFILVNTIVTLHLK